MTTYADQLATLGKTIDADIAAQVTAATAAATQATQAADAAQIQGLLTQVGALNAQIADLLSHFHFTVAIDAHAAAEKVAKS